MTDTFNTTQGRRYEHDCDACVYLGWFGDYDLYYCPREPTVVARYGVHGDYYSGLAFVGSHACLREAYGRAKVLLGISHEEAEERLAPVVELAQKPQPS